MTLSASSRMCWIAKGVPSRVVDVEIDVRSGPGASTGVRPAERDGLNPADPSQPLREGRHEVPSFRRKRCHLLFRRTHARRCPSRFEAKTSARSIDSLYLASALARRTSLAFSFVSVAMLKVSSKTPG